MSAYSLLVGVSQLSPFSGSRCWPKRETFLRSLGSVLVPISEPPESMEVLDKKTSSRPFRAVRSFATYEIQTPACLKKSMFKNVEISAWAIIKCQSKS